MVSAFSFLRAYGVVVALAFFVGFSRAVSFDIKKKDNLAIYWGQNGHGTQQNLAFYCEDETIDVIPLAFLYIFRGAGGEPVIDFSDACANWNTATFPGTDLANCSSMTKDIKTCQSKGKLITLSLGGATGQVGFSNDTEAETFADQIWNQFLGGHSSIRPFGDAILDGLDLDIESGTPAHYAAFVNRIHSHASGKKKKYYISAAPQCPFPDQYIGAALNGAHYDMIYVQFYNNYCGLDQPSEYNFATWDNWAKTQSPNKNVKIFIGAAGSAEAAGEGYVNATTLNHYVTQAQEKWSSFGGVMMWDADTAFSNNRFDKAIKTSMTASAKKLFPSLAHSSVVSHAPTSTRPHIPTTTVNRVDDTPKAPHEILKQEPRKRSRFFR